MAWEPRGEPGQARGCGHQRFPFPQLPLARGCPAAFPTAAALPCAPTGKTSLCGRREQTSRGQDPSGTSRLREVPIWEMRGWLASGREQQALKMVKKAASGHLRVGLSHWWNLHLAVSQMHKSGSRSGHAKNGKSSLPTRPRTGWGSS